MQDCAREACRNYFSDEQSQRKIWTFSGIFKHILDKKWIFSRSLKKDIDQDMIFCTKPFFDRISRKYPSKFFDIISDLVPGKRIYIRDILSLDIYPYQVWVNYFIKSKSRKSSRHEITYCGNDYAVIQYNLIITIGAKFLLKP